MEGRFHVHFFEPMDLEKPAYQSSGGLILIYKHFDPNSIERIMYTLPIHFRYQMPSENMYTTVVLHRPLFYLKCADSEDMSNNETCLFNHDSGYTRLLPKEDDLESGLLQTVSIPAGQRHLQTFITKVTLMITVVGCISILFSIFRSEQGRIYFKPKAVKLGPLPTPTPEQPKEETKKAEPE